MLNDLNDRNKKRGQIFYLSKTNFVNLSVYIIIYINK